MITKLLEQAKAAQFKATPFSTAEDKAKFVNQFKKLVMNGFRESDFPKWFYNQLMNTFQHIAHFNQGGFWGVWFSSLAAQADFLRHTAGTTIYGSPEHTFSDAETAIQRWLLGSGYVEEYAKKAGEAAQGRRRELYEELKKEFAPCAG